VTWHTPFACLSFLLAWGFAGVAVASVFAARDGKAAAAQAGFVIGLAGAGVFAWIGAVLW
jgi:hypothetical protein